MKIINKKVLVIIIISFSVFVGNFSISLANLSKPIVLAVDEVTTGPKSAEVTTGPKSDEETTGPAKSSNIFTLQNPLKVNSLGELIQSFVQIFTYLVILFAVLMFIYIGFKYVTNAAQGNASEITKLHNQLMWLIVGVAVVIGARVLIQVIINTLSATGTVSPDIIQSANNAIGGK